MEEYIFYNTSKNWGLFSREGGRLKFKKGIIFESHFSALGVLRATICDAKYDRRSGEEHVVRVHLRSHACDGRRRAEIRKPRVPYAAGIGGRDEHIL